jgi:putative hydroxymethylpyrimidine transport system substrate-binding protein
MMSGRMRTPPARAALLAAFAVLAVAFAGVLSACGERTETIEEGGEESFELALDFYANPDHIGIYQALAEGHFKDAGLDVKARTPSDPAAPIKQVAAGRVDLAISYEPEVFLARDQGLDVVAVGALTQGPLTTLTSLRSAKIKKVRDLAGKKVATAGIPYQDKYLETILRQAGLPTDAAKPVNVGLNLLPALLGKKVDAMLGGFRNIEDVELRQRGKDPRVVPIEDLGVPRYDELVLVARGDAVQDEARKLRLFIGALARGTRSAVKDPKPGIRELLRAEKALDRKLVKAEVKATLPILEPRDKDRPYGYMNSDQWSAYAGWLYDNGLLSQRADVDGSLTNDLLPGTGL